MRRAGKFCSKSVDRVTPTPEQLVELDVVSGTRAMQCGTLVTCEHAHHGSELGG